MNNPYENSVSEISAWVDSEDSRPLDFQELKITSSHLINKQRSFLLKKIFKNFDVSFGIKGYYKNRIISDYIIDVINFSFDSFNITNDESLKNVYNRLVDRGNIEKFIMNYFLLVPIITENPNEIKLEFVDNLKLNGAEYSVGVISERTMKRFINIKDIISEIYEYEYLTIDIDGRSYKARFKYFVEDIMSILIYISQ